MTLTILAWLTLLTPLTTVGLPATAVGVSDGEGAGPAQGCGKPDEYMKVVINSIDSNTVRHPDAPGTHIAYRNTTTLINLTCERYVDYEEEGFSGHSPIQWWYSANHRGKMYRLSTQLNDKLGHALLSDPVTRPSVSWDKETSTLSLRPIQADIICCHNRKQFAFIVYKFRPSRLRKSEDPGPVIRAFGNLENPGLPVMLTSPPWLGYGACAYSPGDFASKCPMPVCVRQGGTLHLKCRASNGEPVVWLKKRRKKFVQVKSDFANQTDLVIRNVSRSRVGRQLDCDLQRARDQANRPCEESRDKCRTLKYLRANRRPFVVNILGSGDEDSMDPEVVGETLAFYPGAAGSSLNITCRVRHADKRYWFMMRPSIQDSLSKEGPTYTGAWYPNPFDQGAYGAHPAEISVPVSQKNQTYLCIAENACGRKITLTVVGPYPPTPPVPPMLKQIEVPPPQVSVVTVSTLTIVGFLVLVLAIVGVVCSRRHIQMWAEQRAARGPVKRFIWMDQNPNYVGLKNPTVRVEGGVHPYEQIRHVEYVFNGQLPLCLNRESLTVCELIGTGQFGTVNRGHYTDPNGRSVAVALKMLKTDGQTEPDLIDFLKEMKILEQLDHPNVVHMVGVCLDVVPYWLVMEFCGYGSLKNLVERPYLLDAEGDGYVQPSLTLATKKDFAAQIVDGMAYLESIRCVHRDLACRNVLVSGEAAHKVAKISDFGLARNMEEPLISEEDPYYRMVTVRALPIRWMAPETLNHRVNTNKSDVWSFGVVVWELMTNCDKPYKQINNENVGFYLMKGHRLDYSSFPREVQDVIRCCFQLRPDNRPSFAQLQTLIPSWKVPVQQYPPQYPELVGVGAEGGVGVGVGEVQCVDNEGMHETTV